MINYMFGVDENKKYHFISFHLVAPEDVRQSGKKKMAQLDARRE